MMDLAYQIFGLVSALTGLSLMLMAVYVKLDYQVKMRGLKAVSAKKGGGTRFIMSSVFGTVFSGFGAALWMMGQNAAI